MEVFEFDDVVNYYHYACSVRDAIVFTVAYRAFSCGRAKTIRIRYVWTHKDKILRFQKYPDTCGRGLRRSRIYKHCYPRLVMRFRN